MGTYAWRHPPTRRLACPGERYGRSPEEMSDRDLVAAVIGSRSRCPWELPVNGLMELANLSPPALAHTLGITPVATRRLAAALELHRRLLRAAIPERPGIRTPEAVAQVMAPWADLDHERFWCLPLDARSRLIGDPIMVSAGDIDGTEAGPRSFFRGALRCGAHCVVAVHNHPTGDPSPSAQDRAITRRLNFAGLTLDINLADHVIIVPGGAFLSLRGQSPELFAR